MLRTAVATMACLALLGLALGAFFGTRALVLSEEDPVEKAVEEAKEATALDNAKPRFEGELGDFILGENSPFPPCPGPTQWVYDLDVIRASELYSPALGDSVEAIACADGTIVSLSADSHHVGRRYFVGPPGVPLEAPRERLKLLAVAGNPAIAEVPIPGNFLSDARLLIVERFPTDQEPGILTWVYAINDLDGAIKLAEQIMGATQ
jgi:hypothetical protein